MASRAIIDEFLANKRIALMRPSPSKTPAAGKLDEELAPKGYEVEVVYLDREDSGRSLAELAEPVGGVVIAVPAKDSERAVREAIQAGVPRIWLQAGCASKEAIALCEESNTPTVHGACVLMYAEPVKSVHAFHRGVWKVFGKYAD
jgi:predicted CoA-binding protein